MSNTGNVNISGSLGFEVARSMPTTTVSIDQLKFYGYPQRGLTDEVNDWRSGNQNKIKDELKRLAKAQKQNVQYLQGALYVRKIEANTGRIVSYGLAGTKQVTSAGVASIVSYMNGGATTTASVMKFHGIGTGASAEDSSNTALQTEATTQYNPDNTRATGSQAASSTATTATYTTVGTNTVDGAVAATEHGIFSNNTVGAGILLDRTVFSVVNLASADALQTTYVLTFNTGG
jgi:hypothetical protein